MSNSNTLVRELWEAEQTRRQVAIAVLACKLACQFKLTPLAALKQARERYATSGK